MLKRSSCTLWSQTFSVFVRCFMSSHKRQKPGLERWLSHESALLCRGPKFCFCQSCRGACHGCDSSSRTHRALLASWSPTGMTRKDHWRTQSLVQQLYFDLLFTLNRSAYFCLITKLQNRILFFKKMCPNHLRTQKKIKISWLI